MATLSTPPKNATHDLTLSCRERGTMTGIEKVISSCETALVLVSACGGVTVSGEKLRIVQYNAQTGVLDFEGTVSSVKYSGAKQPLIKRIFR